MPRLVPRLVPARTRAFTVDLRSPPAWLPGPATAIAVESLRLRGRWLGPIAVLTDRPNCLADVDATAVPVTGIAPARGGDAAWILAVKALKTRLFEVIDNSGGAARASCLSAP